MTYAGDPWTTVERVACCTGSGGSLIDDARDAGADAYVTSDLKYHDADRAEGLPLVTPAARPRRAHRAEALEQGAGAKALAPEGVEVRFAETDTDPWQTA